MITLPANIIALIESGRYATRFLLRIDLDAGAQGVWSDTYPLTYGGVTYQPVQDALNFGAIRGSAGLNVDQLEITTVAFSAALSTILGSNAWHQRPAALFRAYLDDAGNVVHVQQRFSGFLDHVGSTSVVDGVAAVVARVESNARELNRAVNRVQSDSDQRGVDTTDGFYRYAGAVAAQQEIYWGRKGPQNPFRP